LLVAKAALAAFLAMYAGFSACLAADVNSAEQFAVEGSGRIGCTQFNTAYKNQESAEYQRIIGFVDGYLTAANRYEPNTFDLSPWHNGVAFGLILNKHCGDHPEDTLVSTLQRMVTSFLPIRLAKFSQLVEVGDDKYKTVVYDAILRRAQSVLKMRGLYQGEEDGKFTPVLREAFRRFQEQNGLTPTGIPDPATLWTLLNP
jgi:hypothetical protein